MAPPAAVATDGAPLAPVEDLTQRIRESQEKLHAEQVEDLSRKRGPGRPRKSEALELPPGQAVDPAALEAPAPLERPDEATVKLLEAGSLRVCDAFAESTGFDGFRATEKEAHELAVNVEPALRSLLPQLGEDTAKYALGIITLMGFAGNRALAYARWKREHGAPAPSAAPITRTSDLPRAPEPAPAAPSEPSTATTTVPAIEEAPAPGPLRAVLPAVSNPVVTNSV